MTIQNKACDSTFVVKYMNQMGRAGHIRVILHLMDAKYSNEFVTVEQVAANRAAYPFGHVPVLIETKPDGTIFEVAEAIAIEHYLADKFGLLGSNVEEATVYKSIAFNIYFELYNHCFAGKVPIHEAIQDPESEFNVKALPQFIACHERWLNKNGNNGHYFGDKLTYPDLAMLQWIRLIEGMGVTIDTASPIKKLESTLRGMKEWRGQYDGFHPFHTIEA